MTRTILGAASLLALALADPAMAGSPYADPPNGRRAESPAAALGVPGVPNLQGCVPWCQRDMSPCDPPSFKRADARCNDFN